LPLGNIVDGADEALGAYKQFSDPQSSFAEPQFPCIAYDPITPLAFSGDHHDAYRNHWGDIPVMSTGAAEHMSTNDNPDDRVAWLLTIENNAIVCDRYDIP
jgi:hypothetical protein